MKKYSILKTPLDFQPENFLKDLNKGIRTRISSSVLFAKESELLSDSGFRKSVVSIIFLLFCFRAVAPESNSLDIISVPEINPFTKLMEAVSTVETRGNNLAYNEFENAAGKLQIRQVKIDEYNRLTGNRFTIRDMFDPANSETIFYYFASVIGPYNFEKIAKRWNGSGPKTEIYWRRVKEYL